MFINHFIRVDCINSTLILNEEAFDKTKVIIPAKIISNYVLKYAYREKLFLSTVFFSSNDEQEYIQEFIFKNLVTYGQLDHFSYNVLNEIDQWHGRNKYAFHLIFVDNGVPLE